MTQKNFLAVKFSAYNFTFPAAKNDSDIPVAYRFCPIFLAKLRTQKIFLESPLISRSGSGTYHNIVISLCIKVNCLTKNY